jgi:serine/threonine protein kinase
MRVLDQNGGFPITSLREIKILKKLSRHPNIVNLHDVVVGRKKDAIFLVFEYCDIDLLKLIDQMYIDKITFSAAEVKCLILQLIKGVKCSSSCIGKLCSRKIRHPQRLKTIQLAPEQERYSQNC